MTWNQNGTLKTLAITDGTNPAKSQTCNYVYDDLARISTVNCQNTALQNVWNQIFGYDVFGNITKTVPTGGTGIAFQPTYSSSTNQITSLPGATVTYDPNGDGNLLQDGAHSYTWDRNWGNPASIDTVGLTFDALGRMVEQSRGSSYTQILYGPSGYKLARMNGSSVVKYMAPLAAGMQAVYTANTPAGVAYWRHADWLGSSRLATTVGQTVYYDGAYAPFGENYAETGTTDRDFTGQTQDTTPGLYDFLFRQQSSAQGRWLVPDPAGLAAVDLTNPQTWNRYAYVGNNPLNAIDPYGLYCAINADGGTFHGCQGTAGIDWGSGEFQSIQMAFTPTAVGFWIPTDESGFPQGYGVLTPLYGNWDMVSVLGQVIWSPWYKVMATLEGPLKKITSYKFNPQTDIFVALPDNTLWGQCVDIKASNGASAQSVPVGDVGPINGGGPTLANITAWNDPYWSPGGMQGGGFHAPATSAGIDYRGIAGLRSPGFRFTSGTGIDLSYALQQQLGLSGNATVSWRFAPCN